MKRISYIYTTILLLILITLASACTATSEPAEVLATSVTLSQTSLEMTEGWQAPLDATILPENATDKSVVWTSSKESVATVTPDGIVEAMSAGTAYITATNKASGRSAKCEVNVKSKVIHVTGIALDKASLSMTEGEEQKLMVTITPEDATDKSIVWKSDNETVATVSDGVVKALRTGSATILATTVDGEITARCIVSVDIAVGAVTLAAIRITCREAELVGRANLSHAASDDLVLGVLYSKSREVAYKSSENIEARSFDSDYNFSLHTKVLEPETTYYYRSYVSLNGEMFYGEVKSFTTLPVSSLIQTGEASDIHTRCAVLSATLNLTDCHYDSIEYGFRNVAGLDKGKYVASNLMGGKYSISVGNLQSGTECKYRAYVNIDGQSYYGEERSFTTEAITVTATADVSDISHHSATISGEVSVEPECSEFFSTICYSTTAMTVDELKSNGLYARGSDRVGSYSASLPDLFSGTKYYFIIWVYADGVEWNSEVKTFTTLAPKYVGNAVDLGLSVKWADCNIGAEQPHEFGEKYAWGETIPKADYSLATYKWCESNGEKWTYTKYCCNSDGDSVDNKTVLEPEDDVAYVKLGDSWRMPTYEEWRELRNKNNCSWDWTEDYNGTGVAGYVVKSKKPGFEGRAIFLPAAGSRQGTSLDFAGTDGMYWSSSLSKSTTGIAWYISFSSKEINGQYCFFRVFGCSVRPVSE